MWKSILNVMAATVAIFGIIDNVGEPEGEEGTAVQMIGQPSAGMPGIGLSIWVQLP